MSRIGEQELKQQLKSNEFNNAYLIYGEESFLKEHYVKKLREKLVDPAFEDFNFHKYEGKNASIDEIIMDAQMLPVMSEYSVVLVHDYPLDKSASDIKKLEEFLSDIPETSVVIFWYDSIEVDTKKNSKWKSVEAAFSKSGASVNLERRSEGELVKLICSSTKKKGCVIEPNNARYLISLVGSDIQTVSNELAKMTSYVGEGAVTKEIIDKLAVKSLQARVFDLSRFILRGDGDGAFNVLRVMFAQKEEPVGILSVISSCYVDMYRVKCAKSAGVNENELTKYFSYKGREFLIRNALRDSSQITISSIRSALDILSDADEKMKSTAIDKNILLEETVAKLLRLK